MSARTIRLRIAQLTDLFPQGKSFYQLEEDALYVQIQPAASDSHVFSHLEADQFRLDLDQAGRLLFIELNVARHSWTVDPELALPSSIGFGDIRCLEFRQRIAMPCIRTNDRKTMLALEFSAAPVDRSFLIAESVILQTTSDDLLKRILVSEIVDDLAGREIAAFRQSLRTTQLDPPDRTPPRDL